MHRTTTNQTDTKATFFGLFLTHLMKLLQLHLEGLLVHSPLLPENVSIVFAKR